MSITEEYLVEFYDFIEELRNNSSLLAKKEIIKNKGEKFLSLLKSALDYDITYGVNAKSLEKPLDEIFITITIDELLENLKNRSLTGNRAVATIQYIVECEKAKEALKRIICKDLKCRIDYKIINSVFPNTIKHFEVALAERLDKVLEKKKPINPVDGTYYTSQKFDGVRLITMVDNSNQVKFYSREGKLYTSLDNLKDYVIKFAKEYRNKKDYNGTVVFDGECALMTPDGKDDFKGIVSLIRRIKDGFQIPNPRYNIFDILKEEEFYEFETSDVLIDRCNLIWEIFNSDKDFYIKALTPVKQIQITSQKQLDDLFAGAKERGEEGLILRKNKEYTSGRSTDMLKVKQMQDMELKVIDIVLGDIETVENNKSVTEKMLSKIVVEFRDTTVGVGSGFTKEERRLYRDHPELILNKMVTVQYFEITQDNKGNPSLRFPIFKGIRNYE